LGCASCSSATNCSSCQTGYNFYVVNGLGSCVTTCPSGYYPGVSQSSAFPNNYNYQCLLCLSPCLTCSSITTCTSCITNFYIMGTNCYSSCPSGFYAGQSTTGTLSCLPCNSPCTACTNTSTYCTACPSGYALDSSGNCNSACTSPTSYYNTATR
jgi:hypothetical protein